MVCETTHLLPMQLIFVSSLPDHVVDFESVRTCKSRLDKFLIHQSITLLGKHI